MNEGPVNIEQLQREDAGNEDFGKYNARTRRKIRKKLTGSFSDQLKKKFRQQNLERANGK